MNKRRRDPLRAAERHSLEQILSRRKPELLPLLEKTYERLLTQDEREALRDVVADELMATGYLGTDTSDKRGRELDDLIDTLGNISEWPP